MKQSLNIVFLMLFALCCENIVASDYGTLSQRHHLAKTCIGMQKNINAEFIQQFGITPEAKSEDGQKIIELAHQRLDKLNEMIRALQSVDAPLFNALRAEYNDMASQTQQLETSFDFFKNLK